MTSPRLAAEAVALLESAGARIHYMEPFPTPAAIAALAQAVGAVAILSRQGPVTAAVMDAAP
ncbi:MAG: 3-phosphoglycerate dehydrogenase, partial [Pseudomonadota bacterium]|nr:3-phosphoglycerate dehydrogenase [Pseudomonadota bacterium]